MADSNIRKQSIAYTGILCALLCCATLAQAQTKYVANLSPPPYKPKDGDNSPPPPQSNAQGSAEFVIGTDQSTYSLSLRNVPDFYQATINLLPAGNETRGPVVYILPAGNATATGKTYKGSLTPSDFVGPLQFKDFGALAKALDSGLAYVNVRTNAFPVSAIQGRIQPASGTAKRPASRRLFR
eukprot:jgi/Botrbrau1/5458/Bobra.27_1s0009.1